MARKKQQELIRGHAAHRRTEGDYMGVLLETVTLDDWRGVVSTAKAAAKVCPAGRRAQPGDRIEAIGPRQPHGIARSQERVFAQ